MKFNQLEIAGVFTIELDPIVDERGFFARSFDEKEFITSGLNSSFVQSNISFNRNKGTLRGMHYQVSPYEETKLVRCTLGAIFDVVIDIRCDSPTFKQWLSIELTGNNRKTLYIPQGIAHGFQTLDDNTEVFYQMSEFFTPDCARGIRWNDPTFAIDWPLRTVLLSKKDRSYSNFELL